MGGGRCVASGEGLSLKGKYERSEVGGAERGNLCVFQNLVYIYLVIVTDQKDGVSSVDSTYSFYFSGSGDRIQQGTERRRLKHNIKSQNGFIKFQK